MREGGHMTDYIKRNDAIHAVLHNDGQAAVAAVQEIKAVDIDALVRDLHSLMWYGDGCRICAHVKVEQREPYEKLGCKLGCADCRPLWRGFGKEQTDETD